MRQQRRAHPGWIIFFPTAAPLALHTNSPLTKVLQEERASTTHAPRGRQPRGGKLKEFVHVNTREQHQRESVFGWNVHRDGGVNAFGLSDIHSLKLSDTVQLKLALPYLKRRHYTRMSVAHFI